MITSKNRFSNIASREVDERGLKSVIVNQVTKAGGSFTWDDQNLVVTVNNKTARISVNLHGDKLQTQEQLANRAGYKFHNALDAKGVDTFFKTFGK